MKSLYIIKIIILNIIKNHSINNLFTYYYKLNIVNYKIYLLFNYVKKKLVLKKLIFY